MLLAERLQARRAEIEQAILTRVYSVSDPADVGDPVYVTGLRAAVAAAVCYGIAAVEEEESDRPAPVPVELLSQARAAARNGVSLDTVLRRYVAGHSVIGEFIIEEVETLSGLPRGSLQGAARSEALVLEHLIGVVAAEYRGEVETKSRSRNQRHAARVRRLLAGEPIDTEELEYEVDAWHVGLIAVGVGGEPAVRELAEALDRRPLLVRHGEEVLWAWLGGARDIAEEDLRRMVAWRWPGEMRTAVGEPARGTAGWRLTHRQAAAALPVAMRGEDPHVRYADVALLASALQDEVLMASLRDLYLAPLDDERDGGLTLRHTLRAYFAAERNVSSTAAALGVSRQTVGRRLLTIEQRLGRPLGAFAVEVEAALRLEELSDPLLPQGALART